MCIKKLLPICSGLVLFLASCSEDSAQVGGTQLAGDERRNFPEAVYEPDRSQRANDLFALGRKLFYDPSLSADDQVSCATCHLQYAAFSDPSHPIAHGVAGRLGRRNAPGIFNIRWVPDFMWDGGINHIEVLPVAPLTDPVEMAETLENIVIKVDGNPDYSPLFERAFGSDSITMPRILKAFAQFMGEMDSRNSLFDRYARGEEDLNTDQKKGLALFDQHCSSCHSGALFTDFGYRNNGLDSIIRDPGRMGITGLESDRGKFRTPSLRNVALTPPYMHDGRFVTLTEVLQHYRNGIKPSATLDESLRGGITLSDQEAQQIIVFLQTLSDVSFTNDPRFSQP